MLIFSASLLFGQPLGTKNKNTIGRPIKINSTIMIAAAAAPPVFLLVIELGAGVTFGTVTFG